MKALHLISSSGLYGAEKMVVGLCAALPGHGVRACLEVFDNVHSRNLDVADHALGAGVDVRLLRCGGRFDPGAVRRLRADIADVGADLVHTHGYKANLYGYLATRRPRVPVVATNHRFDRGRHNTFDKPVLRRFDAVYAVSDEARDCLRRDYGIADALTIPNGVEPATADALPALDLPRPLVGMVARLAPEKAPGDLLAVASALPATTFVLVGDGPLRGELRGAAGPNVVLAGFCEDMPGVYASLDLLVQPSYREGMPMTILEAMAAGVPVVATRVGAAADVIDDGRTGLLVDPGDVPALTAAVRALLADPSRRAAIADAARREVSERFTVDVMAARYAAQYSEVLVG